MLNDEMNCDIVKIGSIIRNKVHFVSLFKFSYEPLGSFEWIALIISLITLNILLGETLQRQGLQLHCQ